MKVEHLKDKEGRAAANQFFIYDDDGNVFFQSHGMVILKMTADGKVTLDRAFWDCSGDIREYREQVLDESTAETRVKVNSGEYELADLNPE